MAVTSQKYQESYYIVERKVLNILHQLEGRFYSEKPFAPGEMRDMANTINAVLNSAEIVKYQE